MYIYVCIIRIVRLALVAARILGWSAVAAVTARAASVDDSVLWCDVRVLVALVLVVLVVVFQQSPRVRRRAPTTPAPVVRRTPVTAVKTMRNQVLYQCCSVLRGV